MAKGENMNIGIPLVLVKRIDKFLESDSANEMGLSSRRQLVIMLVREFLQNTDKVIEKERMNYFHNLDYVGRSGREYRIKDIKKNIEIIITDKEDKIKCTLCNKDEFERYCIHEDYLQQMVKAVAMKKAMKDEHIPEELIDLFNHIVDKEKYE